MVGAAVHDGVPFQRAGSRALQELRAAHAREDARKEKEILLGQLQDDILQLASKRDADDGNERRALTNEAKNAQTHSADAMSKSQMDDLRKA